MTISIDSGANPSGVTLDASPLGLGTVPLTKVVLDGAAVWSRATPGIPGFPASIPLVTVRTSDGKTTYIRDAALGHLVQPDGDGKWGALYSCDCTFEVAFQPRGIARIVYNRVDGPGAYQLQIPDLGASEPSVLGVSGMPDGYAFEMLGPIDTPVAFHIAKTQAEMYAAMGGDTSGLARDTRDCRFNLYSNRIDGEVFPTAEEYALLYVGSGLVYQGDATMTIWQT